MGLSPKRDFEGNESVGWTGPLVWQRDEFVEDSGSYQGGRNAPMPRWGDARKA